MPTLPARDPTLHEAVRTLHKRDQITASFAGCVDWPIRQTRRVRAVRRRNVLGWLWGRSLIVARCGHLLNLLTAANRANRWIDAQSKTRVQTPAACPEAVDHTNTRRPTRSTCRRRSGVSSAAGDAAPCPRRGPYFCYAGGSPVCSAGQNSRATAGPTVESLWTGGGGGGRREPHGPGPLRGTVGAGLSGTSHHRPCGALPRFARGRVREVPAAPVGIRTRAAGAGAHPCVSTPPQHRRPCARGTACVPLQR